MTAPRRTLLALLLIPPAVLGAARLLTRAVVAGDSMTPTLCDGDRLLLLRYGAWRGPRPGDVALAQVETVPGGWTVKRVRAIHRQERGPVYTLLGDNRAGSTDSRAFGPVPRAALRAVAIYRYAPPSRRGRLPCPPRTR